MSIFTSKIATSSSEYRFLLVQFLTSKAVNFLQVQIDKAVVKLLQLYLFTPQSPYHSLLHLSLKDLKRCLISLFIISFSNLKQNGWGRAILRIRWTRNIYFMKSKMMLAILHHWQFSIISGSMVIEAKRFKGWQKKWLRVLDRCSTVWKT